MAPSPSVEFRDRALVLGDTLVLADLHLGRGEASNVSLPLGDGGDVVDRFEALVDAVEPERVVFAGDVVHMFDTVPRPVVRALSSLSAIAEDREVDVVATAGNHDALLESVFDGRLTDATAVGETVVCHGHEAPDAKGERYVVGHDHPAIAIEGRKRPCYLVGDGVYRGADLIVLPAFNRYVRGVRINGMRARDFQSPLVEDADALSPVVVDEAAGETLAFPPLGEFRHRL